MNSGVVDSAGHKIGFLAAVYVDTSTDESAMATVRVGVPPGTAWCSSLWTASSLVKSSPAIGTGDVLPVEDEEAVFRHYQLLYQAGASGERQLARR